MNPRARRLALTFGGALAAGVISMSVAVPAGAVKIISPAKPTAKAANPNIRSVPMAADAAAVKKVVEHWRPERLKQAKSFTEYTPAAATPMSAKPLVGSRVPPTAPQLDLPRVAVPPATPTAHGPAGGPNVNLPGTVGKVFFEVDGKEYWCSATALSSANRNLVATAGHCAYNVQTKQPAQNWIFVPAYGDGGTPYGIYVGQTLNLHAAFATEKDYDYDYAFVNVHSGYKWEQEKGVTDAKGQPVYRPVSVGRLGDNVGGQGFDWNRGSKLQVYSFGYPAGSHPNGAAPFDGSVMKWCHSTSKKIAPSPRYRLDQGVGIKCPFTPGASGGPWLAGYNNKTRTGYLVGVNSLTWDTNADSKYDQISSPYFNAETAAVYKHAVGVKTG
ncbi:trypsin-like serine peptidase [Rhizohabitans arisaemae]|uniref:trypsin-like serine peptidase n=1 Tax=Rhizohabitans arisaemae TaxID=2720610 RepID=UPI0024B08C6C|nr:serine protease [Rhizohabitans arisaemae]